MNEGGDCVREVNECPAPAPTLVILRAFEPVNKPLEPHMFFSMDMHKDKAEADRIRPSDLGHLDGERLIGGRKLHMKGETGAGGQRVLTHHMTAFFGKTCDQPASRNITTGK
jgi:hypothetical protein